MAAGIPLRPVVAVAIPLRRAAVAIANPPLPTVGAVAAGGTAGVNRRLKKSIFVSSSVKKSGVRRQKSEVERQEKRVHRLCLSSGF